MSSNNAGDVVNLLIWLNSISTMQLRIVCHGSQLDRQIDALFAIKTLELVREALGSI